MSFDLQVFDRQTGILAKWPGLATFLTNSGRTTNDIKRVALVLTDTETDHLDPSTDQQVFYQVDHEKFEYLISQLVLIPGRYYDIKLTVSFTNGDVERTSVDRVLWSIKPAQPIVTFAPNDGQVTLTFQNLGNTLVPSVFNGSSRISRVYVDLYRDGLEFRSFHLDLANWNGAGYSKSGNNWSYVVTGLTNQERYECQVRYENDTKESDDYDLHVTASQIPSAPQNVKVVPNESGLLNISWEAPSDANVSGGFSVSEYWIYRKITGSSDPLVRVAVRNGAITNYTDSGLVDGTTYSYFIRAALENDVSQAEQDITSVDQYDTTSNLLNVGSVSSEVYSLCFDTSIAAPTFSVYGQDSQLVFTLNEPTQNTGLTKDNDDYYQLRYRKVNESSWTQLPNILRTGASQVYTLTGLVNGQKLSLQLRYVQKFTNANAGYSPAFTQDYQGAWANEQTRTPFSQVENVSGLVSTPVNDNEVGKPTFSTATNGKLKLSWNKVVYDVLSQQLNAYDNLTNANVVYANTTNTSGSLYWMRWQAPNVLPNYLVGATVKAQIYVKGVANNITFKLGFTGNVQVSTNVSFNLPSGGLITLTFQNVGSNIPFDLEYTRDYNGNYAGDTFQIGTDSVTGNGLYKIWSEGSQPGEFTNSIRYRVFKNGAASDIATFDNSLRYPVVSAAGNFGYSDVFSVSTLHKLNKISFKGGRSSSNVTPFTAVLYEKDSINGPDSHYATAVPFVPQPNQAAQWLEMNFDEGALLKPGKFYRAILQWSAQSQVYFTAGGMTLESFVNASPYVMNQQNILTENTLVENLSLGVRNSFLVEAYYQNTEDVNEKKSLLGTQVGYNDTTRPFYYPTNGSNLALQGGDQKIDVTWTTNGNANGGYNLRYEIRVYDNNLVLLQTKDNLTSGVNSFTSLTNGMTHRVELRSYTTYLGERYYNAESGLASPYVDLFATRTPYSTPVAVTNVISKALDANNLPLSTKTNGRLELSWTALNYDLVSGSPGVFTNQIRYRFLNASNSVLSGAGHDGINSNSAIAQELSLGNNQTIKVQAYFYNSENQDFVFGAISSAATGDIKPFCGPNDALSLAVQEKDRELVYTWVTAASGGNGPVKFETQLTSINMQGNIERNQVSPKSYPSLTNGVQYTIRVKSYTEFTPSGGSLVRIYATDSSNVITNGVTLSGIPFLRPLTRNPTITRNINGTSSSKFDLEVSDNGRFLREVLVVGIPSDAAASVAQSMVVRQSEWTSNNSSHPNWTGSVNNSKEDYYYPLPSFTFPYDVKAVLYIAENEAGNFVAAYPNL